MATITIIQGEDRTLNFQIKEIDSSDVTTYMDLTGATQIEMRVSDATTGFVSYTLSASEISVVDAKNGMFKVTMSDTKTALMKLGANQNAEVIIDIGGAPTSGDRRIAQLLKAITVIKRLFP